MPARKPATPPIGTTGFTLLEVLIAVAILAISLSSLMASQMNSMAATRYARDVSSVALLAERQIIELEFAHRLEGWVNSDVELEGDFAEQGYDDIDWVCTIHFIELPEYNQLIESNEGADEASGASDDNMVDAGDQAFGALGVVWPIVKAAIENSIRKVDCTLSWKQGKIDQEFTIQTFWTDPNALQAAADAGGGEFTEDDDDSGEEGGSAPGSTGGGGGRGGRGGDGGGMLPPSMGGGGSGNMGGK
jgi:prepilin-type N-terminal cleavage/methylation domain-containing protein